MNFRITWLCLLLSFIILEGASCNSSDNQLPHGNAIDSAADNNSEMENIEKPDDADTSIPTTHFPEFLDKKYALDPVEEQNIHAEFDVVESNSSNRTIKTSSIHLKELNIDYTYTYFKAADSGIAEINVNGEKRTFVNGDGKDTRDYGDLDLNQGLTFYTIAGEKYLLISCSPIGAQSWFSTIIYGMLIKVSDSNNVMLLSTFSFPEDPYLTGDFYIRQDRFNGKVFALIASPATFDVHSYPDNIFLTIKELHL
ncbi:hypothetical protein SAMN05518672_11228 [Chitinophaga sp. CF118]|uniref:hypothetical protein n=1 Tax=Chitinophaga sp. CF118 TaxID=1884367 RepID=UPI0008E10D65|nr:hypothetical protein [Chitinophaga sp. CF118]SFE91342.1 hypothetical protein SAMN05518672_11228 [Chitinophaga sp. CF118]